jgi:hypothetical protein
MGKAGKTYWLDLSTGMTWKEFGDAGVTVAEFPASQQKTATKANPGVHPIRPRSKANVASDGTVFGIEPTG